MRLVRTSLLNGSAVLVRTIAGLVLNRVLAVAVGPAGFAAIGQFQNLVSLVTGTAGSVFATGVTKLTAQHASDERRQIRVWKTAAALSLFTSAGFGVAIVVCRRAISNHLGNEIYEVPLVWLGFTLVFFAGNQLLLSILNGKKAVGLYVLSNISNSLATAVITSLLALRFGLLGALVALCVNQSLTFVVTCAICLRQAWFRAATTVASFDFSTARELLGYASMSVISALVVPLSQIAARSVLVRQFGWTGAGAWQGVTRVSDIYIALVTGTLSLYFLPRFAEISTRSELVKEITHGLRFAVPASAFAAAAIYLCRDWLIVHLFSDQFMHMHELFGWQLAGDVVKVASWVLGTVLISRGMIYAYISTEIIFSLLFVGLVYAGTSHWGLQGATIAFLLNYLIYLVTITIIVERYLRKHPW